ncbi:hypothetical protein [Methylobacterium sp. J-067]|uniref:hypothetical protein n=1 Tax=Methylobacterium sp. J-067 TaxID=2836648 RepID=UPI001FB90CA5|nr:hypothetical protein [Methylobacterium sp. J-067]
MTINRRAGGQGGTSTSIGTNTWVANATHGTFNIPAYVTVPAGDVVEFVFPSTQDANAAVLCLNLAVYKAGSDLRYLPRAASGAGVSAFVWQALLFIEVTGALIDSLRTSCVSASRGYPLPGQGSGNRRSHASWTRSPGSESM